MRILRFILKQFVWAKSYHPYTHQLRSNVDKSDKTKSVLITSKGFATLRNVPKLPFVSFRFENIRAEFVRGISRSL